MTTLTLLESPAGAPRSRWLQRQLEEHRAAGGTGWVLDVRFAAGGPWAGLRELFSDLLPELRERRPDLIDRHASELAYVLPAHKHVLHGRVQTLTDLAPAEEKVRNYPADRAYRVVHGLIDLLHAWKQDAAAEAHWWIACDGFDGGSHIGRRFFRELVQRRAGAMRLHLMVAVEPGAGAAVEEEFHGTTVVRQAPEAELPTAAEEAKPDPAASLAAALELEQQVGFDADATQVHVADLIRLFREAGDLRKEFRWMCRGLETYNSLGFYEDALEYGNRAWELYQELGVEMEDLRWALLVKLFMSYVGLQRGEEAKQLVEESRMLEEPIPLDRRSQLCYLMAMLHVRYLADRDLARGEEYLEQGLRDLEGAGMEPEDYHFYYVFNRNGLALVRHFQGRFDEAIELCRAGFEQLEEHLAGDKHRLHRSVLLYNMGQVYAAIGSLEQAVELYSAALAMDPTYSEYYNDRGSLYLRLRRFAEAEADYVKAIELSPPYHEVWTNLGQCHRLSGDMQRAVQAYSRALDLAPDHVLTRLGRAQALEALGHSERAMADYQRVCDLDPSSWEALAGRAVLRYESGDLTGSLADLDRAIELAPEQPDLFQNRSVALIDLGRSEDAVRDLRHYLALRPDAEDRTTVESRLRELSNAEEMRVPA